MDESTELPSREWRIDLNQPSRLLSSETQAALTHASGEVAVLHTQPSDSGVRERVVIAARSAIRLGANEHELAVATGFTLEAVRSMLRGV